MRSGNHRGIRKRIDDDHLRMDNGMTNHSALPEKKIASRDFSRPLT